MNIFNIFLKSTFKLVWIGLFLPFILMCGVETEQEQGTNAEQGYEPIDRNVGSEGDRTDALVPIDVQVVLKGSLGGLQLADEAASAYSMTIVCDSDIDTAGGNADELIVTNATGNLRLYKKDQCASTLTSVTVDGVTYDTGSSDATEGNTAVITDGGTPPNSIRVTSTDILTAGVEIAAGDAILYEFEAFDAEADQTLAQDDVENSDDTSRTIEGVHAPNYTLAAGAGEGIQFTDVTATNGAATLTINLVCGGTFVLDSTCDGQAHTDMDFWLVDASDSDGAGGSGIDFSDGVTYAELESLGVGTAGVDLKTDVTNAMDAADVDSVTAGSQGGLSITVDGPYALFEHMDLIFVLKYVDPGSDGNSYLFFDININDLTL